ncbi:hypothetical protein [Streptomyces sp. NPDC002952]|uniref:hypothetical protein n=1 Tax=Streptomyces sp. NPDC002952 TaxID=3364673 RepID=UPI00367AAED1
MRTAPSAFRTLSRSAALARAAAGAGAAAVLLAALAGCSPSNSEAAPPAPSAGSASRGGAGGSGSSAPGSATAADACSAVTTQDLAAVTGTASGKGEPGPAVTEDITTCSYAQAGLLVRLSTKIGKQEAEANKGRQPVQDLPGLGDVGYTFTDRSAGRPQTVVSVVRGTAQVYLLSGRIPLDQLKELARAALGRLG